jgi:two-component system response regulator ChvI
MSHVIALVDDDRNILTSVSIALQAEGFVTRVYSDGATALKAFAENPPDLGVFDIKMPRMDGMELLRRVRETSAMPVIFLTSKDDELDEALGLRWAPTIISPSPFSQRLLIARIRRSCGGRTLPRRSERDRDRARAAAAASAAADHGPARHKVQWDGKDVSLTVTEFMILEALAQRPGVVKSRNQLLDIAYQDDVYVDDRTIDSHIKRIRRKFRAAAPDFDASRPSMASDIASTSNEDADLQLSWSGRWTLQAPNPRGQRADDRPADAQRPLPRGFQNRLSKERSRQTRLERSRRRRRSRTCPAAVAEAAGRNLKDDRKPDARLRSDGRASPTAGASSDPTYELRDPSTQKWTKDVARALDRGFNALVGARPLPDFVEPPQDRLQAWPEAVRRSSREPRSRSSATRPS